MAWRTFPSSSAKSRIMLLLLLLVGLFLAGVGILARLNLNYSQQALSELRLRQIEEAFYARLGRIDAQHILMEQHVADLARLGEVFYRLAQARPPLAEDILTGGLQAMLEAFPEAIGDGLWFEPDTLRAGQSHFGIYAQRRGQAVQSRIISGAAYDYPRQEWYANALPPEWDRKQPRPQAFYWAPAYYHALLETAVLSVNSFIHGPDGKIVGLAASDWRAGEIAELLGGGQVTTGSFAFLIDARERKLSSLSQRQDSLQAQTLLAALSLGELEKTEWSRRENGSWEMKRKSLTVDQQVYEVFFSKTRAGMIFGISVPHAEIHAVLDEMRAVNYQVALITGGVLLALALLMLYQIAGVLRLLETLYTDNLSGLPNRAKLLQTLESKPQASLILLNLDAFKHINDFYGHPCGDHLLRTLAKRLSHFVAASPEKPPPVLYKLPADEFAVLFHERLDNVRIEHCLRELSGFMQAQTVVLCEEQEISLNATLGAAVAAEHPESLLAQANMALESARQQQRHWLVYGEDSLMREEYQHNMVWAKKLKAAIQETRIVPYFQPILERRTGRVEKFECLVRMLDRQGQPITPDKFLPVAKKLRLYRELTRIMVDKSVAVFSDLPYEFSLNLSYEDLIDADTIAFIKHRLSEAGIAQRAVFEILESESVENYRQVHAVTEELKALGARISIDDFGTGYSNFEHLLRLNVDFIKIDGSLIRNLDQDPNARIVTESIVQFAHRLNILTVAEFVHNAEVRAEVERLGVDYLQGYHIGKPAAHPAP
jgi:diguanylate cyclase (GGDEF)-like protein